MQTVWPSELEAHEALSLSSNSKHLQGTSFLIQSWKDGNYCLFTPGCQNFFLLSFIHLFKFYHRRSRTISGQLWGNFSDVIKILWVFVPLIFMGLWMAVKSEWTHGTVAASSLGCAGGRWEGLSPEQDGTEKGVL